MPKITLLFVSLHALLMLVLLARISRHRHGHRIGIGDGGAHVRAICDASNPTFMLTHWVRDRSRGPKLPIERVVRKMTRDQITTLNASWDGRFPGFGHDTHGVENRDGVYYVQCLKAGAGRKSRRA